MSRNGITIFLAVVWSLLSVSLAADDISSRLDKIMELEKSGNTKEMAAAARETLDMMKPDDVRAGFVWYRLCCGIAESNAADRYDELYDMYAEGKFRSNPAFFISVQMENMPQYGYMIDGKFVRGNNRGGGRYANCVQRDRVRLLARMSELISEAEKEKWDVPVFLWNPPKEQKSVTIRSAFYMKLAETLLKSRKSGSSYLLQSLTDLNKIPEEETGEGEVLSVSRPPVNRDGIPVFYYVPKSWKHAVNDGERLRFAVNRAMELGHPSALDFWADFLCNQFDFLSAEGRVRQEYYETHAMKEFLYALRDNETIASLSNGTRRMILPDEFNYIEMYKKTKNHSALGQIYASRMQFERAAEEFEKAGMKDTVRKIRDSQGCPGDIRVFPANTELSVPYSFRNAKKVVVKLYRVNMDDAVKHYLDDVKNQRNNASLWNMANSEYKKIWSPFISKNPEKTITMDLNPEPHHWDSRAYLKFGKMKPGVYLAEFLPDGGKDYSVSTMLWTTDYALTQQQGLTGSRGRYLLNDAITGKPVADTVIHICTYYYRYKRSGKERDEIIPKTITLKTNQDGIADFSAAAFKPPENSYIAHRIVVAETKSGKLTMLNSAYFNSYAESRMGKGVSEFIITDKPVYKPGDKIAVTGYFRKASYDNDGKTDFRKTAKTVKIKFINPQGKEEFVREVPFDTASQSFTFEEKLPDDAMLGSWCIRNESDNYGYFRFYVEEYKKPEYLLSVSPPSKPVKAGEKITVTAEAKYYFGAPMANVEISYKVFRNETSVLQPFRFMWNWLYGSAYGFCRVFCSWDNSMPQRNYGRVLIQDTKGKTDDSGRLVIEIDTANDIAKFGERDFQYTVEAEVRDSTNRVVHGSGSVIAGVKPFHVYLYAPWGFARTGERQSFRISARTLDGNSVKGKGVLRIFRRVLNQNGVPERIGSALKTIPFIPDDSHYPEFILNEEGVYEIDAEVISDEGVSVSKSDSFFVIGEKQGKSLFGEYPLTVSTDKPSYQPGETARILVTCNTPGRTVYLTTRAERDAVIQQITMDGYSKLFTVPVGKGDQPNFYVSAVTVHNGKVYDVTSEIYVPPEKKMLNVSAVPAVEKVKPGTVLPVKIRVTDLQGNPVSGSVTAAVYDKSLEAVRSSSIAPVCPFFWSWRRWMPLGYFNNLHLSIPLEYTERIFYPNLASEYGIYFHRDIDGMKYRTRMSRGVYRKEQALAGKMEAAKPNQSAAEEVMLQDAVAPLNAAGGIEESNLESNESVSVVRTNFFDRAFWAGRIDLTESGETVVNVPVPDNLTTWVIRVWSLTPDTRVGEARTEFVVSKDLIARLELPRFMVQGDTLNAVVTIHNNTEKDFSDVAAILTAPGLISDVNTRNFSVKPNGAMSYEVPISASEVKEHTLNLSVKSGTESDALELKLPVLVKGIDKQINSCGRLDAENTKTSVVLNIPEARRPETASFSLFLSPGAAKNMVELLPYLAADDSGDIFGTVNRFIPAISAKLALQRIGVKWEDAVPVKTSRHDLYSEYVNRYIFRCCSTETRKPVFTAADFDRVIAENLRLVKKMVNSDGGWGWFCSHGEQSYSDTTAYVLDALLDLKAAKYGSLDNSLIQNGVKWLAKHAENRVQSILDNKHFPGNTDCLVARVLAKAGKPNTELMKLCYEKRSCFSPYGYAMLALAYDKGSDEAKMLIRNLEQFLKTDEENDTAWLNIPSSCCFFWYGNENETLSAYLELLLRENPQNETARKVAKYLITNVRNSPWRNSCRSLGAAVRALANYVVVSGERKPDFTVTVKFGKEEHKYVFNAENMWQNDGPALFLPADKLKSGRHTVELEFSGTGNLYWNTMLNYFSLEDVIEPAGLEMKIKRNYYRLVKDAESSAVLAGKNGAAVRESTLKYKRIPLNDGDMVYPGDLLETELISTAKNDYDYVVFQDAMPQGFEFEKPVSGWMWNWSAPVYAEYKERGAKFYLRNMARGKCTVFYRMRAQLCGRVTALPARGYGIYAPELKCNGAQQTIRIGQENKKR